MTASRGAGVGFLAPASGRSVVTLALCVEAGMALGAGSFLTLEDCKSFLGVYGFCGELTVAGLSFSFTGMIAGRAHPLAAKTVLID